MKSLSSFIFPLLLMTGTGSLAQQKKIQPGKLWKDTDGNRISGYGAGMLLHKVID